MSEIKDRKPQTGDNGSGYRSNREKSVTRLVIVLLVIISIIAVFFGAGGLRLFQGKMLSSENPLTDEQINISLSEELQFSGSTLSGKLLVTNNGESIRDLSSGERPVNLGVSIVDSERQFINQDYAHLPITESVFEKGATIPVEIRFEDLSELAQGCGLRFEIVQEGVNWFDDTALYYYPELAMVGYDLGTVLSFHMENPTANPYCVSGFSHNEDGFTWTDGNTAIMRFGLASTQKDLHVAFKCGLYGAKQDVDISVNGTPLTKLTVEQDGEQSFTIPGDMLNGEELELRFDLPDAISPLETGEGEDPRLLALKMVDIVIDEERHEK